MNNNNDNLEVRAALFANRAHTDVGQRRKWTGEPYIVHPAEVADIVRTVAHTPAMLAAAWLHDTVEDTEVTIGEIAAEFGPEVAELVGWLTDVSKPADGKRAVRKALDAAHTAQAPAAAQTVKLADLIANTRSIVTDDPTFAKVYMAEKARLLPLLAKGDPELRAQAQALVDAFLAGRP